MLQKPLYTFWQSIARVNAKYAYIIHIVTGCRPSRLIIIIIISFISGTWPIYT